MELTRDWPEALQPGRIAGLRRASRFLLQVNKMAFWKGLESLSTLPGFVGPFLAGRTEVPRLGGSGENAHYLVMGNIVLVAGWPPTWVQMQSKVPWARSPFA